MEKWTRRIEIFLLVIFGLLYIGAKIHFFTRYGVLSTGKYLEEHSLFWAGFAIVGGLLAVLDGIRKRHEPPK